MTIAEKKPRLGRDQSRGGARSESQDALLANPIYMLAKFAGYNKSRTAGRKIQARPDEPSFGVEDVFQD